MALACRRAASSVYPAFNLAASVGRSFATSSRLAVRAEPPESPTFYTGRAPFYDYLSSLERAVKHTRSTLSVLQLSPLPKMALSSLPQSVSAWKSKDELATTLSTKLSASRHRRLLEHLNQLNDFRRIAETAGHDDLARGLDNVLDMFERADKEQHLRRGVRKPVPIDEVGRAYTIGRRKTSSARVWVISSEHAATAKTSQGPPTTEILVNNMPLNEYFKIPVDRERILRPFRLAGLLGAYNVFSLVRGGGVTGQAGAVALGIAKGLAAHVPDVELILRRAKLLRRDPRMVERKKTGRAKARKGYGWVRR
ncbi:ribosomal protein S5 domain 2-like protein [Phellopilus nigrolimitatus]|nr:ribosomal protein S5 domain 2-like protein [Phellopilus nigrolimitatus]